ncbi:MAG: threonine--tRNA ligase [Alphaproteobacteria bacterium]|nr:threonine--tRNA ligase [Alphaproteobacteria bacterium]
MVALTLPDGSVRTFERAVSGAELAAAIGPGLAKAALAVKVDGELRDLARAIGRDAKVEVVTAKSAEALALIRHDAAHVLAQAVQELYPGTQITFGPATEDGFYYDFVRPEPFTPDDFPKIEQRMREIVDRNLPLMREEWSPSDAVEHFEAAGETYKAEWVREIGARGEAISIYRQGEWLDLCVGPHLPATGKLPKAFKLMKVAGAYWRGDAKNAQLQRIYGTAWATEADLKAYLTRLEEAEKRDHRRIGREMGLFHVQEEAVGSVFWHPKGWGLWRTLENFVRGRLRAAGYVEVRTPQLVDRKLWEASGHWEKFEQGMFLAAPRSAGARAEEGERVYAIKPMNCPCHVQIFNQGLVSYRQLPIRMAEFGSCHRYEPSGAMHGLMRVRAFTQDDAHIFCTEDQIVPEAVAFCALLRGVYRALGFDEFIVKFADRPAVRAGTDETWDKAEAALRDAAKAAGLDLIHNPGEGAFYGPKLEFVLRDSIGRDWQCGTLQIDFVMPERLDAAYVGEDNQKHRPAMLHRAMLGSFERFIGILIEHYAGHFPLWLAPVQVAVATITQDGDDYAAEVGQALADAGLRVVLDTANEKIGYKVREHSLAKVPVILAIGKREAELRTVSVRRLGSNAQETLALQDALARLVAEAEIPGP